VSFVVVFVTKDEHGYQTKKYELGWPCGTHGRNEKRLGLRNFSWKVRRGELIFGLAYKLRWEDNIKIDFFVIMCIWTGLIYRRTGIIGWIV
jgi:hypothetical protein